MKFRFEVEGKPSVIKSVVGGLRALVLGAPGGAPATVTLFNGDDLPHARCYLTQLGIAYHECEEETGEPERATLTLELAEVTT